MKHPDSLTIKWIDDVARKHKSDPILVEKVVRAPYLLEHLQNSRLDIIYLREVLLLSSPKRLSIDVDVIVSNRPQKIEEIFSDFIQNSDFLEFPENEREIESDIEKAHYKFYYKPVTNTKAEEEYILLDILYEKSHYED